MAMNRVQSLLKPKGSYDPPSEEQTRTALQRIEKLSNFSSRLEACSDDGWKALGTGDSWACLMTSLDLCGYKDDSFQELLADVLELGSLDFLNTVPATVMPRGKAKVSALLKVLAECGIGPMAQSLPTMDSKPHDSLSVPPSTTAVSMELSLHVCTLRCNGLVLAGAVGKFSSEAVRSDCARKWGQAITFPGSVRSILESRYCKAVEKLIALCDQPPVFNYKHKNAVNLQLRFSDGNWPEIECVLRTSELDRFDSCFTDAAMQLKKDRVSDHIKGDCGVCLQPMYSQSQTLALLPCCHVFHATCHRKDFERSLRPICPTCRGACSLGNTVYLRRSLGVADAVGSKAPKRQLCDDLSVTMQPFKRQRDSFLCRQDAVESLINLHMEHGNNWKRIAASYDFGGKAPMQLKDKVRNLKMAGQY